MCVAFARPDASILSGDPLYPQFTFDYWYPSLGSCWVFEGWMRCDGGAGPLDDINGTTLYLGWATVDWGFPVYETEYTLSTSWTFFQFVFTYVAIWSDEVAAGPQLPAIVFRGPKLRNDETRTIHSFPDAGSCSPAAASRSR